MHVHTCRDRRRPRRSLRWLAYYACIVFVFDILLASVASPPSELNQRFFYICLWRALYIAEMLYVLLILRAHSRSPTMHIIQLVYMICRYTVRLCTCIYKKENQQRCLGTHAIHTSSKYFFLGWTAALPLWVYTVGDHFTLLHKRMGKSIMQPSPSLSCTLYQSVRKYVVLKS